MDKMPELTGAQLTSQTENKLGLKIYTHQIKEAGKNITKIKKKKAPKNLEDYSANLSYTKDV